MNFVIESATGEVWGVFADARLAEANAAHLCYEFAEEDAFHVEWHEIPFVDAAILERLKK